LYQCDLNKIHENHISYRKISSAKNYNTGGVLMKLLGLMTVCITTFSLSISIDTKAATTVLIDNFSIDKNGSTIFNDAFDNNIPPPDTGGNTQSYQIFGGSLGPEVGGKLTLNAANGENVTRPDAGAMTRQGARVRTNIDPLQPANGLRIDDLFSVTGIFDIAIPEDVRERYGVRLTDGSSTGNLLNNSVGISVMRTSSSLVEIVLHHYDQTAFTFTDIATFALDTNHDQIALTLSRLDAANNDITASFAYIDAGVMGSVTTFTSTVAIFDGEDFTRATFMHIAPIPIPPAVWLFGTGLLGLIGIARRKNTA
jgi:hypothetical protein